MIIAYIDAGMGAMLLQWIIAFVIGAGLFFRGTLVRVARKLFGRKHEDPQGDGDAGGEG